MTQRDQDPQNSQRSDDREGLGEDSGSERAMSPQDQQKRTSGSGNTSGGSAGQASDTGDQSAGSQGYTTGYGTGQSGASGPAATQEKGGPSNAGDAGFHGVEDGTVSSDRVSQMSHAEGGPRDDEDRTDSGV